VVTLAKQVSLACRRLAAAGLDEHDARFDAEVLARHALGWNQAAYLTRCPEPPPAAFGAYYSRLIERRCQREPVAQIIGFREFWGLEIKVSRDVLIPRPETELLVETALKLLKDKTAEWRIADIGTGSGCLAIALAIEFPHAHISATETSPAALGVAQLNAAAHDVATRVSFHQTSFLDGLSGPYDLIVSNPPYVPDRDLATLAPEVSLYEPVTALAGGPDGLTPARKLVPAAASRLKAGGWLVMEIGAGQSEAINGIALHSGMPLIEICPDLQELSRVAVMRHESTANPSRTFQPAS
jgi:release factor glutamine methyltransferase